VKKGGTLLDRTWCKGRKFAIVIETRRVFGAGLGGSLSPVRHPGGVEDRAGVEATDDEISSRQETSSSVDGVEREGREALLVEFGGPWSFLWRLYLSG